MPGKPNPSVINWDMSLLAVLRQVLRVASDQRFRSGTWKDISPSAAEIIDIYNLSTDDDWKHFSFDLPLKGGKQIERMELDRKYAGDLVQFLLKKIRLPMRKEWFYKSFPHAWERRPQ